MMELLKIVIPVIAAVLSAFAASYITTYSTLERHEYQITETRNAIKAHLDKHDEQWDRVQAMFTQLQLSINSLQRDKISK